VTIVEIMLKYGKGELSFEVEERRIVEIAQAHPFPPITDVDGALKAAMENSLGKRLEDTVEAGDRVLLLTVDFTRPSPKPIMDVLIERIHRLGASVDVMIGLGNHRRMSDSELVEHIGTANVLQSNPQGPMLELGTTRYGTPVEVDERLKNYDKKVAIGFVEPSYLLGFTGGRKIIMPGVASTRAIARNHFLLLKEGRKIGRLHGNPLSDDALEFARMVGLDWIVDVAINPDDSYASICCGDMEKANETACGDSEKIYSHTFKKKADIVVVGCGGTPYDFDLVQTKKGIVPAMECVRKGGVIILTGACDDGWGGERSVSRQALMEERPDEILKNLYSMFYAGEYPWESAPCSCRYLFSKAVSELGCRVIAVTGINDELEKTFVDTAPSVQRALQMAERKTGNRATVSVIPDGRRLIPV
jgi:nickel-dependent lactate racemase